MLSITRLKHALSISILMLLCYDVALAGQWHKLKTLGPAPSGRLEPTAAAHDSTIYLFGGINDKDNVTVFNDLYSFDTHSTTWRKVVPIGNLPAPRGFSSSVILPNGDFLIFGGVAFGKFFSNLTAFNDLWVYSPAKNAWTKLKPVNAGPEGRGKAAMWLDNNKLYIFGGSDAHMQAHNDLWSYDLTTHAWKLLTADGTPNSPPIRLGTMSGNYAWQGQLILYGGEAHDSQGHFKVNNDTWSYQLSTNHWQNITPDTRYNITPPHYYANSALIGDYLYVQGGELDVKDLMTGCGSIFGQRISNELWRFDLHQKRWFKLSAQDAPQVTKSATAVVGNKLYIFLGYDFICQQNKGPGEVWNLDVFMYEP